MRKVGRLRIDPGWGGSTGFDKVRVFLKYSDTAYDWVGICRQRWVEVVRDELDAMVLRRVMGCRKHHSTGQVHVFDGVSDDRRWGITVDDIGWDAICTEDIGDEGRELLAQEACIVSDDYSFAAFALPIDMVGDGLCDEGDIIKCELAGHHGAPAIGAKGNLF